MSNSAVVKAIAASSDPRGTILEKIGSLDKIDVYHNLILGATYIRPEKTKGGVLLVDKTLDEDKWQGKVFLVLKMGPMCFQDDERNKFLGQGVKVGDWIVCRSVDGIDMNVRDVRCKLFEDTAVKLRVVNPEEIY